MLHIIGTLKIIINNQQTQYILLAAVTKVEKKNNKINIKQYIKQKIRKDK